jgi:hypothetical protein
VGVLPKAFDEITRRTHVTTNRETMKTTVTIIGLSALLTCLTLAAQETPRPAGGGLGERFKQLERNGDGKVSREEGGSLQFFDAADKNKDGLLTLEEVLAYFAARRTTQPTNPPATTTPSPPVAASAATIAGQCPKQTIVNSAARHTVETRTRREPNVIPSASFRFGPRGESLAKW